MRKTHFPHRHRGPGPGTRREDTGRIFRINTWYHFDDSTRFYGTGLSIRDLRKAVAGGLLGWLVRANLSAATGIDCKLDQWSGRTDLEDAEIPNHLDYDFSLGRAPCKPYHPHRVHKSFRGYGDYDSGGLGAIGQHYLDPIQVVLVKDHASPSTIERETTPQHPDAGEHSRH